MVKKGWIPWGSTNDLPERCPTPLKQCWVSKSLADYMALYLCDYYKEEYSRAYLCDKGGKKGNGCGYYHVTTKRKRYQGQMV